MMINKTDKKSTSFREKLFGGKNKPNASSSTTDLNTSNGSISNAISATGNTGSTSPTGSSSSSDNNILQNPTQPSETNTSASTPVLPQTNGSNQAPSATLFVNISANVNGGSSTTGNTSNVRFDQDLEPKLKELEATHLHYKACQNGFKSFLKESSELGRTEELMGQQMVHFSQKMDNADAPSKHLKVITHELGEALKNFSIHRLELNRDIDQKYLKVLTDVQHDTQLNEAKEGNFLEAEADYQKQLRNIKYFLALLEMKNSLANYVEQCSKIIHAADKQIDSAIKQQFENGVFNFTSVPIPSTTSLSNPLTPRSGSIGTQVTLEQIIAQNMPCRSDDTALFGVDLKDILRRFGEPFGIPRKIKDILSYVEQTYIETEGLFRIPGHSKGMDDLAEKLNNSIDTVDYSTLELTNKPHTICGLLKKFTRELPQPLLTFEMYDDFINAAKLPNNTAETKQKQKEEFKKLVDRLPVEHYNLLGRVCQLFSKICQNEGKTKMNAVNISRSFGTNLMRMKVNDDQKMLAELEKINTVCEILIIHAEDFFPGELDGKSAQGKRLTEEEIEEWKKKKLGASSSVSSIEHGSSESSKSPSVPLKRSLSKQFGNEPITDHTPKKTFTLKATENAEIQTNSSQRQSLRGWIEVLDKSRGKFYYFNPANGETSWKHPTHGRKPTITKQDHEDQPPTSNTKNSEIQNMDGMVLLMELIGKVEQDNADGVTHYLKSTLLPTGTELANHIGEILSKDFGWDATQLSTLETNNLTKEQMELFNSKLQVLSRNFV